MHDLLIEYILRWIILTASVENILHLIENFHISSTIGWIWIYLELQFWTYSTLDMIFQYFDIFTHFLCRKEGNCLNLQLHSKFQKQMSIFGGLLHDLCAGSLFTMSLYKFYKLKNVKFNSIKSPGYDNFNVHHVLLPTCYSRDIYL